MRARPRARSGSRVLVGSKGQKDRNDRKAGMPDGVVEVLEGGDGDTATERLRLLLLLGMMLPMEGRGTDRIAEGNALHLGCAGMDEGIFGECWVGMMEKTKKGSKSKAKIRVITSPTKMTSGKEPWRRSR